MPYVPSKADHCCHYHIGQKVLYEEHQTSAITTSGEIRLLLFIRQEVYNGQYYTEHIFRFLLLFFPLLQLFSDMKFSLVVLLLKWHYVCMWMSHLQTNVLFDNLLSQNNFLSLGDNWEKLTKCAAITIEHDFRYVIVVHFPPIFCLTLFIILKTLFTVCCVGNKVCRERKQVKCNDIQYNKLTFCSFEVREAISWNFEYGTN